MIKPTILCAGETLWDVLPSGEFIGGAPFNVAGHAARLGARALLAARLGKDLRGRRALERRPGLVLEARDAIADVEPDRTDRSVVAAAGAAG